MSPGPEEAFTQPTTFTEIGPAVTSVKESLLT